MKILSFSVQACNCVMPKFSLVLCFTGQHILVQEDEQ